MLQSPKSRKPATKRQKTKTKESYKSKEHTIKMCGTNQEPWEDTRCVEQMQEVQDCTD